MSCGLRFSPPTRKDLFFTMVLAHQIRHLCLRSEVCWFSTALPTYQAPFLGGFCGFCQVATVSQFFCRGLFAFVVVFGVFSYSLPSFCSSRCVLHCVHEAAPADGGSGSGAEQNPPQLFALSAGAALAVVAMGGSAVFFTLINTRYWYMACALVRGGETAHVSRLTRADRHITKLARMLDMDNHR